MRFIVLKNKEDIGFAVSGQILSLVNAKPTAALGLATGSSPLDAYIGLIKGHQGGTSFKSITTFNLDEYIDCPIKDETYRSFMDKNLFSGIDINKGKTHFPNPLKPEEYDSDIEMAGGIDIQLLGIGNNGHIGFNEPDTPRDSRTHLIELTKSTREANARFFDNDINLVPTQAVSMGLETIMKARKIILIANDAGKALPIAYLITRKDSLKVPATVLEAHPDCDVYLTEELYSAARRIAERL